jgi:hypothetical protein
MAKKTRRKAFIPLRRSLLPFVVQRIVVVQVSGRAEACWGLYGVRGYLTVCKALQKKEEGLQNAQGGGGLQTNSGSSGL